MNVVSRSFLFSSVVLLLASIGCNPIPLSTPPPPPEVSVATPVVKDVVDYAVFTGTTEESESLEVRARVQGFLETVNFTEGQIVEKDALLYTIEQAPFEADLASAVAGLKQTEAAQQLATANLGRANQLRKTNNITKEEYDTKVAELAAADAKINADKSAIRTAEINLGYTKIYAPFRGTVGRNRVDPGNLVGAGEPTLLTTIRKLQPMYVYFDVSETVITQLLRRRSEQPDGPAPEPSEDPEKSMKIFLGIGNEKGYPHEGVIDFLDNRVDPDTGTALVRGVFPNKNQLLYAGLFARVRIPRALQKDAILVQETAIGTDLAGKYVMVIGPDNIVEQRHLELGTLVDGMRVVIKGLKADERYIVSGLQRARPGLPVRIKSAGDSTGESGTTTPAESEKSDERPSET